jgi:group II intron reverse transcriptase/maturase
MRRYADNLKLIAKKAKQDKRHKFSWVMPMIDEDCLVRCYKKLNKKSACGIDGMTVEEYGNNVRKNIDELYSKMKHLDYWPKPVRRVWIPKSGKLEQRPLGLPTVEDKIVQTALKEILEAIFEQEFLECSHGFRPERSCHTAIKELNEAIMHKPVNFVVDVDIKKFFDTVDHDWMYEMLKLKITDPIFLGYVWRMFRAGAMEDGRVGETDEGTPQGGIISPILANIYLHYTLDLWFEKEFRKSTTGYVQLIRYCDDFVMLCESKIDGERFLEQLKKRLAKFKLEISEEKTQMISFGKNTWKASRRSGKKMKSFDFLGFTHYCKASRRGWFIVGHKTSKKRLACKLKEMNLWLKKIRNACPMKDWWKTLKAKVCGFFNYFGINGNYRSLQQYYKRVLSLCFKWINRRSQKKSMNWRKFIRYIMWNPIPTPRIYHDLLYSMPK